MIKEMRTLNDNNIVVSQKNGLTIDSMSDYSNTGIVGVEGYISDNDLLAFENGKDILDKVSFIMNVKYILKTN